MGLYGIEKMSLLVKEAVYWPGIINNIKTTIAICKMCAIYSRSEQKETLQLPEMLMYSREKLGVDLFELNRIA